MAIVCDLCGGSSFVKEGDFYVCQGCGTKYSLEEAKRMMTSEVSANNKNAENAVLNYMTLGQNAIGAGNLSEAENYANKALEVDSLNPEAWLLKGKSIGWQSTLDAPRIDEATNYFHTAIKYASDDKKMVVAEQGYRELCNLYIAMIDLRGQNYSLRGGTQDNLTYWTDGSVTKNGIFFDQTGDFFRNAIYEYKQKSAQFLVQCSLEGAVNLLIEKPNMDIGLLPKIDGYVMSARTAIKGNKDSTNADYGQFCGAALGILAATDGIDDTTEAKIQVIKHRIGFTDGVLRNFNGTDDSYFREQREKDVKALKELDPNYQETQAPATTKPASNSGGCYVATAVYGSYDCPEVWTLRRYRDYTLAETWYGRMFVHVYYAISPTLVKWFGDTNWFKDMWRPTLDRMVIRLNNDGVADTPYQDRSW